MGNMKHASVWAVRSKVLPKPVKSVKDGPVIVAGLFSTASGIGQSARACYRALRKAGIECLALDLSADFKQADLSCSIPTIRTLPSDQHGTLILHLNAPETRAGLYYAGLRKRHQWKIIGYWAWELSRAPQNWGPAGRFLSEVWTPSEFVAQTMRQIVDIPVTVVPHHIDPEPFLSQHVRPRPEQNGLNVLAVADGKSSFHRKNILGAVEAYTSAFPDPADHSLTVKCRNLAEYKEVDRALLTLTQQRDDVHLIRETLSEADMWSLLQASDVVLSPHRAEGFGLHLAEAMSIGKVAIATNWSGNLEFMEPDNSILLPYKSVPIDAECQIYSQSQTASWADPDLAAAEDALRTLAANPDYRAQLGARAKQGFEPRKTAEAYRAALLS